MIPLLFDNKNYIVCIKPVGIPSQLDSKDDMVKLLKEETGSDIFPVHRLDTAVGGTMIFAKNKQSAAVISKLVQENSLKKEYLAVLDGVPEEKSGVLEDLLFKDSSKNKTFVVKRERKGVKKASLEYETLGTHENKTLVHILLHTGRTHQIRAQFASRKMPVLGDGKYGSKDNKCSLALWSYSLSFRVFGEDKHYTSFPDMNNYPWSIFADELSILQDSVNNKF